MLETWKHKVIREGLEAGHSYKRISNETGLSICAILKEIDEDITLKFMVV